MVNSKNIIINKFSKQKYSTFFNQNTGFFLRLEEEGTKEPFWCENGPELLDISITNYCDRNCSFCYKKSNQAGHHMSLENYEIILKQASKMKVLQIALGGGNPNQHPDFVEILRLSRETYNIVPSYTTNGRGLTKEILAASKKYCGAVAVSLYEPYEESYSKIRLLLDHGIRTNIHFLLSNDSIEDAINLIEAPPEILSRINAVVFLNLKNVGCSIDQSQLAKNSDSIEYFFKLANKKHPFKVGFDSCSISGIAKYMKVSPIFMDYCEAARFSAYISEEMKMYPCSFMIERMDGALITEDNIQTIWKKNKAFIKMREQIKDNSCENCQFYSICRGGCPIYPEINMCSRQ